ncbi:hypothetical protein RUND412_005762 [Rhizina undulata]
MAFADYDKVVLFGDSITEQSFEQTRGFGFGAAILDVYRRKLDVIPRGFSGYNTAHALHVLPQIIPPVSPTSRIKLMTVFLGANDAVLPGQLQHIPLEEYVTNLRVLLTHPVFKPHNPKFVLIAPPPICEYLTQADDAAKGKPKVQRLAANTKKYSDAALALGKELNVPTVDLWKAFTDYAGGWEEGKSLPGSKELPENEKLAELLRDGLHFLPQGYKILYNEVMKTIVENYPELNPEALQFVFPHWEVASKIAS